MGYGYGDEPNCIYDTVPCTNCGECGHSYNRPDVDEEGNEE